MKTCAPLPPREQGRDQQFVTFVVPPVDYGQSSGEDANSGKQSIAKVQKIIALLVAVALFTMLVVSAGRYAQNKPHGCEKDYWKLRCRLQRGDKHHYRNFLAHVGLIMPPAIHLKISAEQLGTGRLLVVGDIHGCRDELRDLLTKANYTQGRDNLVLAGDLVDKGPHPLEVIAEARKLGALSVRGNHDDSGLAAYEALQKGEKVKEKHEWAHKLSAADAHWLGHLPWSISIPSYSLIIVHAGLVPEVPLEDQLLVDLYRMRELAPGDDTRWHGLEANPDRGKGIPWAEVWAGPEHVVFGHDHQRGLQDQTYATGIDTGVVYGDFLTGVLFPSPQELQLLKQGWSNSSAGISLQMLGAEIIQVKAKKKYYGQRASAQS